jgi:hypothetical protein
MKKILSLLAVVALIFMFNQDASAQSKAAKKAAKKATKIMCGCTALKELSMLMKDLEANPDKITPAVTSKMEGDIKKAQACMADLKALSESLKDEERAAFGDQMEAGMKAKCPDMLKMLNDAAND